MNKKSSKPCGALIKDLTYAIKVPEREIKEDGVEKALEDISAEYELDEIRAENFQKTGTYGFKKLSESWSSHHGAVVNASD